MALDIISCILGGGSLVTLLIFLIQRHDTRNNELNRLSKQMDKLEKDIVRTQLLLLMESYQPGQESEIMIVAEHYFADLDGNWYMTTLFNKFVEENKIAEPEWLKKE